MAWTRRPAETDPLMTQSMRTDFPPALERQVIDGGVAEGRSESALFPGLVWLALFMIVGLAVLLGYLWWTTGWFP